MKSFDKLVDQSTRTAIRSDALIKQKIFPVMPAKAVSQIQFCRLEGGRLRITVSSAAWISRLRFIERHIIDVLRASSLDCHTVSYHVSPAELPVMRRTTRKANKLSVAARSVEDAANAVGSSPDDSLRQALLALARSLKSPDQ